MSIVPERPLVISPTLASTIGLEEAVMLHVLADMMHHIEGRVRDRIKWVQISESQMAEAMPFWQQRDIKRVRSSLQNIGLILLDAEGAESDSYLYAINQKVAAGALDQQASPSPAAPERASTDAVFQAPAGKTYISPDWQPDEEWMQQCRQHNIPEGFIHAAVPEFVKYWRDRGQSKFSWGNVFSRHVLAEWRREQARCGAEALACPMDAGWRPSEDAVNILVGAGVSESFIEDAIPEFVLYWRERRVHNVAWNAKFIEHIRRQWAKYSASIGTDDVPRVIPDNWQPSADCYEIIQLAEIDDNFARGKVPEFVLYWKDSQQVRASWNTVFLQYIKQEWSRRLQQLDAESGHAQDKSLAGADPRRVKEKFQRFADRSWAD
ncbi:MAG: DnaT-like ssDNA-binding domain-containing protein [Pseudohongiellaceae bacterium]